MKQKHIDKVLKEGYYIEVDVSNKKMNKILSKLFPEDTDKYEGHSYCFIYSCIDDKEWYGSNTKHNNRIIKASKFFKNKKSLEKRVSKLEKAIEYLN